MPEDTHPSTAVPEEPGNPLFKPEPGLAIWTVVTFVILLVVLKKLAWGPILATLDQREQAIRESLAEAEKARAAAKSSIEEQQRLLQEARKEAKDLVVKTRGEAERARDELVARAKTEAERIVEGGRQAIEAEKRLAVQELRKTTVDLALAASGKLLRSQIDEARGRELVSSYLRELEGQGGRPGAA